MSKLIKTKICFAPCSPVGQIKTILSPVSDWSGLISKYCLHTSGGGGEGEGRGGTLLGGGKTFNKNCTDVSIT